jgi:hypothetical protein
MSILIACFLVAGFGFHWTWYLIIGFIALINAAGAAANS